MAASSPTLESPAGLGDAVTARSSNLVVAVLCSVGLVGAITFTLVIPLVPQLPGLLSTSPTNASWVVSATLIAGAVATPIAGRLGDMLGRRRVLLWSLGLLVLGSLICALTSDLGTLITGRALQGAAVAALPLGISLLRDALPPERLNTGIALMSATLGVGGGLGLPLSALIVQYLDWHVLFWMSGTLALVGVLAVARVIPESHRAGGRFDAVGAAGLGVGLVGVLLVISKGRDWGWASAATLLVSGVAVLVLVGWCLWEARFDSPIVDVRVTAQRAVLIPNLISVPAGLGLFTALVTYPPLLQAPMGAGSGFGLSVLAAGLVLAPFGVVQMLMSPVAARLSNRAGPRTTLRLGLMIVAGAYGAGTVLLGAAWQVMLVVGFIGAGISLVFGAIPSLVMQAVPSEQTAAANGFNTLMRTFGTSTASAVVAVVLAGTTIEVSGSAGPSLGGIRIALAIAGVSALVALALSATLPTTRLRPERGVAIAVD